MLHALIDNLQAKFPPNRVAIALYVVLAPVWAWLSDAGLDVPPGVALTVLIGAAGLFYKWIDGWQKGERAKHTLELARMEAEMARAERENKLKVALVSNAASPEHGIEAIEQAFGAGAGGSKEGEDPPAPGTPAAAIAQSSPPPASQPNHVPPQAPPPTAT